MRRCGFHRKGFAWPRRPAVPSKRVARGWRQCTRWWKRGDWRKRFGSAKLPGKRFSKRENRRWRRERTSIWELRSNAETTFRRRWLVLNERERSWLTILNYSAHWRAIV